MLRSSPHFPPFIVPFYLHWPHFLPIFSSPSPFLVTSHPFVICLNDPYLLPPLCHSSFLITVIILLIPPFSGDPQLLFFFLHSLILCSIALVYLSIHPSINLSFYLSIYGYLSAFNNTICLPPILSPNSIFFFTLPVFKLFLFLSTSRSYSTYLPSLLPFDTLSPCPLIQSSLHYVPSPSSFSSLVHSHLHPSFVTSLSFPLNLSQSLCSSGLSDVTENHFSLDFTLFFFFFFIIFLSKNMNHC